MLAKADLADAWPPAAQGTTFGGNPVACRAGLASLKVLQEDNLMENAIKVGDFIQEQFTEAQKELPMIGDIRGKGLMVAVELINADGNPASETIKSIIKEMGANGIVLTKCGSSALRFAPPLIITLEQASEGVDIIIDCLRKYQW
jgi:4-aminobutyrate aminotransferase